MSNSYLNRHINTITDLGRWSWGRWRDSEEALEDYTTYSSMLQDYTTVNTDPYYLNAEQSISLAAGPAEANQLVHCGNDVIVCRLHVKDLSASMYLLELNRTEQDIKHT